jgi:hypothetical protein
MPALVAGIPIPMAQLGLPKRDGRDKPGHDGFNGASYCESTLMLAVFTTFAHFTMSFSR